MAASRITKESGVAVHKIVPVGKPTNGGLKAPVGGRPVRDPLRDTISEPPPTISEPPAWEKETNIESVRTMLSGCTVVVSSIEGFDITGFLEDMALAKPSTVDDSTVVVSSGKFYSIYGRSSDSQQDFGPGLDMDRMVKLEGHNQLFYIFRRT